MPHPLVVLVVVMPVIFLHLVLLPEAVRAVIAAIIATIMAAIITIVMAMSESDIKFDACVGIGGADGARSSGDGEGCGGGQKGLLQHWFSPWFKVSSV